MTTLTHFKVVWVKTDNNRTLCCRWHISRALRTNNDHW